MRLPSTVRASALLLATGLTLISDLRAQGQVGPAPPPKKEIVSFESVERKMRDGIVMTADHYTVELYDEATEAEEVRRSWGIVIALHDARSSRGEFRQIGHRLNQLGLDVLAVDLRSGAKRGTVENGTYKSYWESVGGRGKRPHPKEAYDDVVFAMEWVRQLHPTGPLIVFGSGSSADLALVYASREEDTIDALFCFSPGESLRGWSVQEAAGKLRVPIYATCGPGKTELTRARTAIALVDKAYLTSNFGDRCMRGVQALLRCGGGHWPKIREMLEELRNAD